MSNSTARDGDISRLHPAIRDKVAAIRDKLHSESIPFEVFEAFRTPERQADLFAQGRTRPGNKVTWVGPWKSVHQYGLAVDFVLKIDGTWSWDDSGARGKFWTRMHEIADAEGLTALFNSQGRLIEMPHVQLKGISSTELYSGRYPDGGDSAWAEHLEELIDNWQGSPKAPPVPRQAPVRPPLAPADIAEMEAAAGTTAEETVEEDATVAIAMDATSDARFQSLHAFIKRWEGGFVNHPRDKGGATNMGITQGTLAAWRRKEVSVDDVRNLTRAEADAILRTNYYTPCRCAELPDQVAAVVYNGAVLHGPSRSVKLLQSGFNATGLLVDGKPLEVDGRIGRNTVAAATQTDSALLAGAYMDAEEAFFRSLDTFDTFGAGWLNRLAALREFVNTLPPRAGQRPSTRMTVSDSKPTPRDDNDTALASILDRVTDLGGSLLPAASPQKAVIDGLLMDLVRDAPGDDPRARLAKGAVRALLAARLAGGGPTAGTHAMIPAGPDGKPPLTPVNAALGQGLGRLLNGKKSVIGVVGMLLTVLVPNLGAASTIGPVVNFVADNQTELLTMLATFTGWGFLGKVDKALWAIRQQQPT